MGVMGERLCGWTIVVASGLTPAPGLAQGGESAGAPPSAVGERQSADDEIIVTIRSNGVDRGEFAVLRTTDGDFWVAAPDFPRLKLKPLQQASRQSRGESYVSFRGLGATGLLFDEAQLALDVVFPVAILEGTHIDLSNRPAPMEVTKPQNSAILNYRASAHQAVNEPVQLTLTTELNVRIGEVLLRQEAKYDGANTANRFARGTSQLVWDNQQAGTRFIAGDQLAAGGPFGTTFPGAGVSLSRLYAITPDVIRQPGAAVQISALSPADVEVAVDGNTIYRSHVGPGPIALDNLVFNGGARTVRVTVTDATGHRQVIEQPFFFTDSLLAKGLHEYSYFAGRRSELGADNRWVYGDGAWQAFHRYGATNELTLEAGAEGTRNFASGGAGASMRNDALGLLSLDLLASTDRSTARQAQGWSARYTYMGPKVSVFASRRLYGDAFRTLASTPDNPALLSESRLGASTRVLSASTLSTDLVRSRDGLGEHATYAVRFSSNLGNRTSLHAEYQLSRTADERVRALNVYLRFDLDRQQWISATGRASNGGRGLDVEAGRQLAQGEGLGYRVGVTSDDNAGQLSAFSFGSANWNLKPFTVELNGTSQISGGRSHYAEAAVSGSVVALDGYVGMTREVGDGFALARLGVPQPGVDIFMNSQAQGKTDAQGNLLIPQVGAYGRQDVSLDDKQLSMQYNLAAKRVTIAPAYKSGTIVDFGGRRLRAVTGTAWLVRGAMRKPVASHSWTLTNGAAPVAIETMATGEFYLEDAAPGLYRGTVKIDGVAYSCQMTVPDFPEAVHELQPGVLCE